MKKLIFITVAVLGALAVSNCGKETEKVIERVEVQKGNQILSGIGAPDASLGNVGDYYLDKSTGKLYGAKTAQGWGTPINLKGQDGANGSNGQNGSSGTKILSGTTTPTISQGEVGDWYIDTQNKHLYGPKTESGWGTSFITLGEGNTPQPQPQPQTISPDDYELSNNGRMLSKWKNKNFTSIDMQADEVLRNVTDISTYVFQNHTNLTSIVLPEGLKTIGGSAFEGCNLKSVVIPNGVREIGPYAFSKNQLTAVTIPNSVTRIWYSAFSDNKLTSVIIPNGITIIENNVFSNNKLTSVVIPSGVTKIGYSAFSNNKLTSVIIPNGITIIEDNVFSNNKLTSVVIPNTITVIETGVFSNNQLTSIIIPNNVIKIEMNAFWNNQLTSVTIGTNVKSIGETAFHTNQLISITFPSSVTNIGDAAFSYNELKSITFEGTTPPTIKAHFDSTLKNIYVPANAVNAYKNAVGFREYESIIKPKP